MHLKALRVVPFSLSFGTEKRQTLAPLARIFILKWGQGKKLSPAPRKEASVAEGTC